MALNLLDFERINVVNLRNKKFYLCLTDDIWRSNVVLEI